MCRCGRCRRTRRIRSTTPICWRTCPWSPPSGHTLGHSTDKWVPTTRVRERPYIQHAKMIKILQNSWLNRKFSLAAMISWGSLGLVVVTKKKVSPAVSCKKGSHHALRHCLRCCCSCIISNIWCVFSSLCKVMCHQLSQYIWATTSPPCYRNGAQPQQGCHGELPPRSGRLRDVRVQKPACKIVHSWQGGNGAMCLLPFQDVFSTRQGLHWCRCDSLGSGRLPSSAEMVSRATNVSPSALTQSCLPRLCL